MVIKANNVRVCPVSVIVSAVATAQVTEPLPVREGRVRFSVMISAFDPPSQPLSRRGRDFSNLAYKPLSATNLQMSAMRQL